MFRKLPYIALVLHAYVAWRLLPHMAPASVAFILTALWLAVSLVATPLWPVARRVRSQLLRDRLTMASMMAMGAFSSLFVLTLARDLALLGTMVIGAAAAEAAVRAEGAVAVPALAALVTLIGFINARRRAAVRRVDVPIEGLPLTLHGFSIAQISDIHVGPTIKREYLERVVDAVNGLSADMIAVTGDLVDGSVRELAHHTAPLERLTSRHGTFFVTGNHEYYSGAASWVRELRRLGLEVLMNEHVVLRHEGAAVVVAGVTDLYAVHYDPAQRSDPAAAMSGAPTDAAVKVLLAHQPQSAYAAASAGFDLQLSGHTHGGQFFPWNLVVRFFHPFTAGLHRVGRLWIYISRGTGYWGPPKRFGAPSEITYLRLVSA